LSKSVLFLGKTVSIGRKRSDLFIMDPFRTYHPTSHSWEASLVNYNSPSLGRKGGRDRWSSEKDDLIER
jgi:hypothetical protein